MKATLVIIVILIEPQCFIMILQFVYYPPDVLLEIVTTS